MIRLAGWLAAANLLQLLLGVARQGALGRWLGSEELGRLAYALALVSLADGLPLGAAQIFVRDAAAAPRRDGVLLGAGLGVRLPQVLLLAAGLALHPAAGGWAGLLLAARNVERFSVGALQAARRRGAQVASTLLAAVASLGAVLLAARLGSPDWRIGVAALALAGALGAGIQFALAWTGLASALAWSAPAARAFVRASAPIWVAQLAVGLLYRLDVIMLRGLLPQADADRQIGYYQPAYTLIESGHLLLGAVVTAAFPVFASLHGADPARLARAWRTAAAVAAGAGALAAAGTWGLAVPVVGIIFGDAFGPGAGALRWLAFALPIVALNSLTSSLLVAVHRQADVTRVTLGLVAVNGLANLWAIPRFGFTGAAAATVLTEAVGCVLLLALARPLWSAARRRR